ncbi:MAG: nucleoside deaminase [Magnetococcales bacterium]|nr:nucleoside deaminase [Magnetococcales bacterium]
MLLALVAAGQSGAEEEVPVGAVLRDQEGRFLAEAGNRPIADQDPTAHAEMVVLRRAARRCGNYRLLGSHLAVSLQPCPMCHSAVLQARVATMHSGAERKQSVSEQDVGHFSVWDGSLFSAESAALLRIFFDKRRHV